MSVALATLMLFGCKEGGAYLAHGEQPTIAVLLADGRLGLARTSGEPQWREYRLTTHAVRQRSSGLLAQSTDGRYLVALAPQESSYVAVLSVVDLRSGSMRNVLLRDSASFSTLTLGEHSGAAYLVGRGSLGVIIARYDLDSLVMHGRWRVRDSDAPGCDLYSSRLDAKERYLYVSYHGMCEGADRIELTREGPRPCRHGQSVTPCVSAHGLVLPTLDGVFVATGSPNVRYVDSEGWTSLLNTGLNTHLMEFTVDTIHGRLAATGSCGYGGGFAVLKIPPHEGRGRDDSNGVSSPEALLQTEPFRSQICGERLALEPDGNWVAVARRTPPPTESRGPGEVTLVDLRTQTVISRIPVSAPPLDVLVLR